jgi:hypothetical protein
LKRKSQPKPKTSRECYIHLPTQLVIDIKELNLTKSQTSHCFKFVGILYRDSINEYWDASAPTPKSKSYLYKTFSTKYNQWLDILLEHEIVQRSEHYSPLNHLCFSYWVNPKYILLLSDSFKRKTPDVLCVELFLKPLSTVSYRDVLKGELNTDFEYRKWFTSDINNLKIDYDKLNRIIDYRIDNLVIDEFTVDYETLPNSIRIIDNYGKMVFYNTAKVLDNLKAGQCIVKYRDMYRIVEPESYLNEKRGTMYFYYMNSIERLKNLSLDAKRNTTNYRLDTNLTNMASLLVDEICKQNNLVQIDLSNSQFTLLSNVLKQHLNTPDFIRFKELSATGQLYQFISNKLHLKADKNGKMAMFEIMFSSRLNNNSNKKRIKELFPSVIKWIDDYKNEHGDNQFSIMLQRIESELFIDAIFKRIKKAKLLCFSKHDSLIVKAENTEQVIQIMKDEFAKLNLEYRLKVSTPIAVSYTHLRAHETG